ncbi:uncharacterized protein HMPREF1541_03074 [Cyphellophora europaea CBS 101466]|uniref:AB hydrolase-1 domain-containing protein n=1 Tax=Cyphellophora europaea (strain CBS 101466) TaxID=1220924 RepID=W2RZL9_CYPE1|nr:uncharacterized protein HMPREF1541_03074 [Cyphellophora europaea CBS 101466]ETN41139.1 hypothetical protein HMPREF1541_03074 [Cyphellophora europaea CBS 101466]
MLRLIWNWWVDAVKGFFNLRFRRPVPKYHPLPDTVSRTFVATTDGEQLEFLVCRPQHAGQHPPVLLMHGAFGHASVWLNWMTYLHDNGYGGTTYAISVRGHGASYSPSSYFRMLLLTTQHDVANDVLAAFQAVKEAEGTEPVLIAHSSGTITYQELLSRGTIATPALGLIGGVPHFGITPMFENWAGFDRWMKTRLLLHLGHPKSNISTVKLLHRAFFGPDQPLEATVEFAKWAADSEAMRWPLSSTGTKRNGQFEWLDCRDVVASIAPRHSTSDSILIVSGTADRLMRGTSERLAAEYRTAMAERINNSGSKATTGVRLVEIDRSGHHVQNDVHWQCAAKELLSFLEQV